jgi:hypothetical protein
VCLTFHAAVDNGLVDDKFCRQIEGTNEHAPNIGDCLFAVLRGGIVLALGSRTEISDQAAFIVWRAR